MYVDVPSNAAFHRCPVDCYRFGPDGGKAVQSWARRCGCEVTLLESCFFVQQNGGCSNDFVAMFCKGKMTDCSYKSRIMDSGFL